MPFIETKTSKEISLAAEAKIRRELGKAIEIFNGKSEAWLMLNFVGGARMAFKLCMNCAICGRFILSSALNRLSLILRWGTLSLPCMA